MSDQKRSVPVLVVMDGPEANKSFAIENDEVIVGREETCDIVLRERQISREHIRIYRADGRYYADPDRPC